MDTNLHIKINGRNAKSKKAVKEAVAANPELVYGAVTSMFGGNGGRLTELPPGQYGFCGPDPYNDRRFYGTIVKKADGTFKVT
jgi:hypothetical protein